MFSIIPLSYHSIVQKVTKEPKLNENKKGTSFHFYGFDTFLKWRIQSTSMTF